MTASTILLNAASGTAGDPLFVENVFSTFVYDGTNDNNHSINNGIDLSGEGGLVWIKSRDVSRNHALYDTERGVNKYLSSNTNSAQTDLSSSNDQGVKAFNSNGFTMDDDALVNANDPGFVSWTFRKAPKFFDIQTWSGDNSTNRSISHNINGTVGSIFVKRTNGTDSWYCYHRGIGETKTVFLESSLQAYTRSDWGDTAPTSSAFTVNGITNTTGYDYVAYIFGHNNNDGGYGDNADQDIIKCGSFTDSSSGFTVDLGFEPQWLFTKRTDSTGNWEIVDNIRGFTADRSYTRLYSNLTNAEQTVTKLGINSQGFFSTSAMEADGAAIIYVAIRRGPMATPETASSVFGMQDYSSGGEGPVTGFVTDMGMLGQRSGLDKMYIGSRLTGPEYLKTNINQQGVNNSNQVWDRMDGVWNTGVGTYMLWGWQRRAGYFDVVVYSGSGSPNVHAPTLTHNLAVVPEMVWARKRNTTGDWAVVVKSGTGGVQAYLRTNNGNVGTLASTGPSNTWSDYFTSTQVIGDGGSGNAYHSPFPVTHLNSTGSTYIMYLFATLAGISKVGSVTHSGSSTDVDCGFSSGASLVTLKRTDADGDWFWWDSTRGIVSGNDPYLLLNYNSSMSPQTAAAEVTNTDYIDPLSSGFTITDDFTDGDYIFYAIAAIS